MQHDDVLKRRARALAQPPAKQEAGDAARAVVAIVGPQQYAFPIGQVLRVKALGRCTPVPNAPPGIVGVAKLEGKISAVFGARSWRGLPEAPRTESPVVILGAPESPLLLLVDAVVGTVDVPADAPDLRSAREPWLRAILDEVLLVDVPRLIELLSERAAGNRGAP